MKISILGRALMTIMVGLAITATSAFAFESVPEVSDSYLPGEFSVIAFDDSGVNLVSFDAVALDYYLVADNLAVELPGLMSIEMSVPALVLMLPERLANKRGLRQIGNVSQAFSALPFRPNIAA